MAFGARFPGRNSFNELVAPWMCWPCKLITPTKVAKECVVGTPTSQRFCVSTSPT